MLRPCWGTLHQWDGKGAIGDGKTDGGEERRGGKLAIFMEKFGSLWKNCYLRSGMTKDFEWYNN